MHNRKNWLFAGSDDGGDRAAAIYSLIGTAKLNGLNPEAYCDTSWNVSPITLSTGSASCYRGTFLRKRRHLKSQPEGPQSMQNPSPQAPELKALLAHLQTRMSSKKRLRVQAAVVATEVIALAQRQSRLKKK
jgi:hypothetical protein